MNDGRNQTAKRPSVFWRVIVPAVAMLLVSGLVILYGHRVFDYFAARSFTPSGEIAAIHDSLKLTSRGSDLLYASEPQLENAKDFNQSCSSTERTVAILGCYYMRKIYIFDISNPELAGAKEVTAAHEMLHAAYERLNYFERQRVDTLLEEEYSQLHDNAQLKKLMEYYQKAEPNSLANELHSLLGTTVATLSPELERYYEQYFGDRQHIVAVNKAYNTVFETVEARSQELAGLIRNLETKIETDKNAYLSDLDTLKRDIEAFKQRAASGYYRSNAVYQNAINALNARIADMESRRALINQDVSRLNDYIEEQNKLSVRVNELNNSINGISEGGVSL
mgnify:CR=1 FL=1